MSRTRPLAALAAAVCLTFPLHAQSQPASATDRATVLRVAREIMQKVRYCALITLGEDGQPQARVMDAFPPENDLTVWMATNPVTRKTAQIARDPRVTLHYFDPAGQSYVTLLGRAEIVRDPAEKAARWKDDWASFYKDRNRGDDYVLIRVRPRRLEIVSLAHGLVNDALTWRPIAADLP